MAQTLEDLEDRTAASPLTRRVNRYERQIMIDLQLGRLKMGILQLNTQLSELAREFSEIKLLYAVDEKAGNANRRKLQQRLLDLQQRVKAECQKIGVPCLEEEENGSS